MKIIVLFFLLFFSNRYLLAQETYSSLQNEALTDVALITNPQIGTDENAKKIIEVVDDINKRENIFHVVILGNITANGKFDEFIWAQEILDGLTAPYFVVGGEKDYILSEGKGSEIALLWGENKNIFSNDKYSILGINTILPEYSNKKHIEAETLSWFESALTESPSPRIITFSYHPLKSADNGRRFFEMTLNYNLFSFVGKDDKTIKDKSVFEGFYLNRKDGWGYLLISVKMDTIFIKKILSEEIKKKAKPEIVKTSFVSTFLFESIKPASVLLNENKLWTVNLDKTIQSSPAHSEDKFFVGFKNGSVICLNQSGKEKWRYDTNGRIHTSPLIEKDLLVTATTDGDILTLNANTGNLVQVIGIGESITSDIALIDIEEAGLQTKGIVAGTVYGNLFCYDLFTLEPIWINQINNEWINSSIVSSKNKIFFQDKEGTLYCVSADNGLLIWNLPALQTGWKTPIRNSDPFFKTDIVVDNNNLYLLDAGGNFYCIDALLGTGKWNIKNINATGLIRVNKKNELLLPSSKNKILTVSPKLGKVISEIELPAETIEEGVTDLLVIGDKIIIGFTNGWVYEIKPKHKPEKIFRGSSAPVVSLIDINGNCLVTDYDGQFTLLNISSGQK